MSAADAYRTLVTQGSGPFVGHAFPIHALDRLGVPVWATATWTEDGVFCNGVGYGHREDDAQASAWGELVESLQAYRFVRAARPLRASYAQLVLKRGPDAVLDPRRAPLPAGSCWQPTQQLAWLPARSARDGRDVLVPLELVASRFADLPDGAPEPLFTPVTNGLGAGLDEDMALAHGVREIVQRDGNSVAYRALDQGIGIDLAGLEDPVALELLERYEDAGVEVRLKLAGVTCGMPSVYCVGFDRDPADVPHPLVLAACGEAAHPRRDVAVRKALLEFAAARSRRQLNHAGFDHLAGVLPQAYVDDIRAQPLGSEEGRSLMATVEWSRLDVAETLRRLERVHAVERTVPLAALPDEDHDTLEAEGFEALWVSFGGDAGATAGKAIVPGLEVESVSYGRVGPRNLRRLSDLGVAFAGYGAPPAGAVALHMPDGDPEGWLHPGRLEACADPLYALYREPGRHVAALRTEGTVP